MPGTKRVSAKTGESCCYLVAICISRTTQSTIPLKSATDLLDLHGFKDKRYSTLAIGTFLASLGLYVPYYYIGQCFQSLHQDVTTDAEGCRSTICGIHFPSLEY